MNHKIRIVLPRRGTRHGFTLVELLVTITIIIVLAALSVVVNGKVRDSARQANAISAMRQIGVANIGYYSENSGSINVIRDDGEKGSFESGGTDGWFKNSFVGRMQPFLFSGLDSGSGKTLAKQIEAAFADLYKTTDFKTMAGTSFSGVWPYADTSGILNPIAVNTNLRPKWGAASPPLKVSSIDDPSSMLYLTYGRYYFTKEHGKIYTPMPEGKGVRGIHYLPNRQGIFCFLDGHIEVLSPPILEKFFEQPLP